MPQHENGESGERKNRAPRGSMHEGESLPAAAESLRTMHAYKKLNFGKILQKTEVSPVKNRSSSCYTFSVQKERYRNGCLTHIRV